MNRSPAIGNCGLCLGTGVDRAESHIFPKWVYRRLRGTGRNVLAYDLKSMAEPRQVLSSGDWDHIVCHDCEKSFNDADSLGARFFDKRDAVQPRWYGSVRAYVYAGWDQALLRRFFLTCLFRSHLSGLPMDAHVDLGARTEPLRRWLLGGASDVLPLFEVAIYRTSHKMSEVAFAPQRTKNRMWRFAFPSIEVWVNPNGLPGHDMNLFALGTRPEIYAPELSEDLDPMIAKHDTYNQTHAALIDRLQGRP